MPSVTSVLSDRNYRRLFLAQISSLLGTGLATIGLSLLAFDLAGPDAGMVLGTAFAIKMIAYVGVSPFAAAFLSAHARKPALIGLDLFRVIIAAMLPLVTEIWQIYVLIFVLQSASAAFTPTFQATIPDILKDEERYTKALSLSRLAYDLENLISPLIATLLLSVMSFNVLFAGTSVGFALSAALIMGVTLPAPALAMVDNFGKRLFRGTRIFFQTPRLRGLMALNLAVAALGAPVLVNTIIIVRETLSLGESAVAVTLGAFGGGSMLAAFILPSLLRHVTERTIMFAGAVIGATAFIGLIFFLQFSDLNWPMLLMIWFITGFGYSATQTPSGRLLRKSAHEQSRPSIFAAQFSLSHACWLFTYPLAGWFISQSGFQAGLALFAGIALIAIVAGYVLWPSGADDEIEHRHDNLPADHPHLNGSPSHRHVYMIDEIHAKWP
ncbi:MFS transporter [Thalassospira alkalitolerans]|uniref:MFS transporter n=1 Tax=Thalassospira alkalitolerans TaxID=1293890 RepID=UPI0030ED88F6|tara:strand:- start:15470 stop:16789 length:1320 start_codon:yes stop_codon:yes gene_type:complete